MRFLLLALFFTAMSVFSGSGFAQTGSCTTVGAGATIDITAHGECRKVSFSGLGGATSVCAVTGTTLAEWQSFYNNPPSGVTIAACSPACAGYSYAGFCYFWAGDMVLSSCDTVCASRGGANAAGTRYIGSDDSSGARCSAVASAIVGSTTTATPQTGHADGCFVNSYKGGWISGNSYSPITTTAAANLQGRICACGSSGGGGGSAACVGQWEGGTVAHGASVTAYITSIANPCGFTCDACLWETRTCNNGSLSGSYWWQNCTENCVPALCN